MATKFLDYTGLSYLWSKIKTWCNSIFATKATDEDITGTKTFVGSKKIAFKQSGTNDKLGFTLYNNSNKEQGYLEYNPTNKVSNVPLFTLGNYATATNELTYVGFRRYSNISGASGAYNLLAPLISDAKTPFNLTTTYTNFYLPLGISDGTSIVTASNSGIIDIGSLLSGFLTSASTLDATKLSGTIPSTCYTDTNTTYTAGSGLSLIGTEFSLDSHNQASDTINLLTGYSKPSTSSALATTDTLNQALGKLEAKTEEALINSKGVPVGTIVWLSTSTVPVGYLLCNGQAVGRDTYPDLFTAIGTTYGSGDGSTTFNLPNLIDKFIEGANSNIGSNISAGLPNITATWRTFDFGNRETYTNGAITVSRIGNGPDGGSASHDLEIAFNASRASSIYGNSSTVQPPAVKLLPCIKAYSSVDNLESLDAAQLENYVQNNFVHLTGDEFIQGIKTFSSSMHLTRVNPYFVFKETDLDRTTNSGGYHGISFNDKNDREVGAVLYVAELISGQSRPNRQVELKIYNHGSTDTLRILTFMRDGSADVWSFQPRGGTNDIRLGNGGNRWKQLYATTTSIDTSDERLKSYIEPISNDILDAWEDIEWYTFKMNDAISEKGVDKARIHSGLIAQRLASIFEQHGLDGFSYSFLCYDKWNAKPASYDKEGKLIMPEEPAGDEYSIRYVEALCIEAAYQRRKNKILENRISELERQVSDMLVLLQNLTNSNG